jgi:hypothetical protein
MKRLAIFLLIVSTVNLLWFPVTDGVHEVLHSLKSRLHTHGHNHDHDDHHHHSSHHVEEHDTVKNLLNALDPTDDQQQSVTVTLFLFFSVESTYFFFSCFAGMIPPMPEGQQYTFYITPLTPPPLV